MEVAILTVGDELLAGDTTNTNATWLAEKMTERGVSVRRILVVPDERSLIADRVRAYGEQFDAVLVTGGIGGTPDDVTIEAVADALDRDLIVSEQALAAVERRLEEISDRVPDLDVDRETEAAIPAGARPLVNPAGLSPGCVAENVYVFPGIPGELKAMFREVEDEFSGAAVSQVLYTTEPEANIVPDLKAVADEHEVTVGCYPDREQRHNRLKVVAADEDVLAAAVGRLRDRIPVSETPVERDWGEGGAEGG
jgi:nicotinamide-nucleotide amidase